MSSRPDELDALRNSYEHLVEQQKAIWAQQRKPDDPPGGVWETSSQPRLLLHLSPLADQINEQTANAVEIWLHENMQGLSSELLGVEDAAVNSMMLMCNPVRRPWPRPLASRPLSTFRGTGTGLCRGHH